MPKCRSSRSSSAFRRKEILEECHRRGIVTIGTATTRDEAVELEDAGVEVVVASGFEAGGHRGSFLRPRKIH